MKGWPFTAEEMRQILDYCAQDVDALRQLLLKLLPYIDLPLALHRGEAVAALARSEHVGVPVDMEIFSQLADKKTWREIRDNLVPRMNVGGIYACDKAGEWHWNNAQFEKWTTSEGINWPRTDNGKLNLQRKTFESMCKAYPQAEPLRQLDQIATREPGKIWIGDQVVVIGSHPVLKLSVFICPTCQNTRYKLFEVAGRWACYRCHGLTHASRHVHRTIPNYHRLMRLRRKISADPRPFTPIPPMPSRQRRYWRIVREIRELEAGLVGHIREHVVDVLERRDGRQSRP